MWLLLVEDEKQLANSMKRGLEEEGYVVEVSYNGEDAEVLGLTNDYDIVILDWRLPGKDGRKILEHWRKEYRRFPVLMLTALNDTEHKIQGLDTGADDYLGKPFSFEELLARLRALLRRNQDVTTDPMAIQYGPIHLDIRKRQVSFCSEEFILRPKEFTLLELLLEHPRDVFSKTQLAERVWGSAYYISDNVIEVTVSTLRQKLTDIWHKQGKTRQKESMLIETIRGAGYRLNSELLNSISCEE